MQRQLLSVVAVVGMAACGNEIAAPGLLDRRVTIATPGDGDGDGGDPGPDSGDSAPADEDIPDPPVIAVFMALTAVSQTALAGDEVPQAPAVVVRDQYGHGMPGKLVRFTVETGGGHVNIDSVTTDSQGRAELESWTLGKRVVPNQVKASLDFAPPTVVPVQFNATVKSDYTITVRFLTSVTTTQRAAFEGAASRWSAVVVGDLPDFQISRAMMPSGCARDPSDTTAISVDDMIIFASVESIDGPGGVLAQAGPCLQHPSGAIKAGVMSFDSDDLAFLESNNVLEGTILHEMGHVIGIGSVWSLAGLIISPSIGSPGANTRFTGDSAAFAFSDIGGTGFPDTVPVENNGVPGSADAHWRESIFGIELMSPAISGTESSLPLSAVTVASLSDLGVYMVNDLAADAYTFGMALRAPGPPAPPLGECRVVTSSELLPFGGGSIEAP